jgi:uncharacterized protein YjbJ (UPF0337 family)
MKDKTEGKFDQAKGKVKEEVGDAMGDRSTEWSGKAEQAKGHVKEGIGEVKDGVDEAGDELAEEKHRTETPR